jgi:TolB-like protein/Flp pilus assembly protein TadD
LTPALEYFLSESQWIDVDVAKPEKAVTQVVDAVRRHIAGEHAIDPGMDSGTARPLGNSNRLGAKPAGRWSKAAIALGGVLALVAAFVVIDRFGGFTHKIADTPVAVTVPAVQSTLPAATVISEKSVAVLPFVDMSEKKDQEYFSDGMSEELINLLTNIPDLQVPSRTSAFYFKGKSATVSEIARALGVAYVLEGSVRQSGKTLRVTAQLVRAGNGYHVWSQTFDRPLGDVFKVQDEVASAVVKALKVSLMAGVRPNEVGTKNVEAYELYLQARSIYLHGSTAADFENVVKYLRQALNLDDSFARAWANLAGAYGSLTDLGAIDPQIGREKARDAAKRAIAADPNLAYGHLSLAIVLLYYDLDFRNGYLQMQQALSLDPSDGLALSMAALQAASRGQFEEAISLAQRGVESDPVHPYRYFDLSQVLYHAGKYEDALAAIHKQSDLNPTFPELHSQIAEVLLAQGNPQAALAETDRETDTRSRELCGCAIVYDALGRRKEADASLADMEKNHGNEQAYEIARIYANRGNLDQAFKWFDRAYQQRDRDLFWVKVDPMLKNVQTDPRFFSLMKRIGLSE